MPSEKKQEERGARSFGLEAFKIWAPTGKAWTDWAKPAMFINMRERDPRVSNGATAPAYTGWLPEMANDTALILDLPGKTGVLEALALAEKYGFRPVPLYNGTRNPASRGGISFGANSGTMFYGNGAPNQNLGNQSYPNGNMRNNGVGQNFGGQNGGNFQNINGLNVQMPDSLVDVDELSDALAAGAERLKGIAISDSAPPVFMLDSGRMGNGIKGESAGKIGRVRGMYDNRWVVFLQDFPSAEYLLKHGIRRVVLRSDELRNDLAHVLYGWQKKGVKVAFCATYREGASAFEVKKPSHFQSMRYRLRVSAGLSRNAAGGFGAKIPEQMNGGYYGGGVYYGFG